MSVYAGEYARLYDLFYGDKPYDDEATFVHRQLDEHADGGGRRLLDVACGTGQHAVRLAASGWDVTGVDQSDDMLAVARERGDGHTVAFVRQDMRALDLGGIRFDAATCLFDSIGYAVTNDAIASTLDGIRRHLRAGGLLMVEFWHAPPMLREHEPTRVREWREGDDTVLRLSRTQLDVPRQVASVSYSVYRLRPSGSFDTWTESHENRFFLVQEMAVLLDASGFDPLRWYAGYDVTAPIDASTWHVLALARARADG